MTILTLRLVPEGPFEPEVAEEFRSQLEREVGETSAPSERAPGAKGIVSDLAAIAVSLFSPEAIAALAGVIKSHFEGRGKGKIVVVGPGGKEVHIEGMDARTMATLDLAGLIDKAMADDSRSRADAPRRPRRV